MNEKLNEKILNFFENSQIKLVDTIIRGDKKNKIIELFVDSEEGILIDDIAKVNSAISEILDNYKEETGINEFSKLIVSSPGVDNSFKFYWQLKKHIGRDLVGILKDGKEILGKIMSVDDNGIITLDIINDKKKKQTEIIEIDFKDFTESKIKLKF